MATLQATPSPVDHAHRHAVVNLALWVNEGRDIPGIRASKRWAASLAASTACCRGRLTLTTPTGTLPSTGRIQSGGQHALRKRVTWTTINRRTARTVLGRMKTGSPLGLAKSCHGHSSTIRSSSGAPTWRCNEQSIGWMRRCANSSSRRTAADVGRNGHIGRLARMP